MELDHGICYRALCTRDTRFDGRFFTGVRSTGVYCRPVCPARTPQSGNCRFFACAAAAEEAGFRPCRRCRPETAPGTPAWRGTSATVARALRLIDEGALDRAGTTDLAARLGVGDRHLRRLFAEHLGASPQAVARTRRAHFAKRLLEQTQLPMIQVALAAGFRDVRRFNAAVRDSFAATPTQLRSRGRPGAPPARRTAGAGGPGRLVLRLAYREPLDWAGLLEFLAARAIPGVESVTGSTYRRAVALPGFAGIVALTPAPGGAPWLELDVPIAATPHLAGLVERSRRLFDLDADPAAIAEQLAGDPLLAPLVARWPGARVPGAWDRFELAVRAILGQQVTVKAAGTLAGRLAQAFGAAVPGLPAAVDPGFPVRTFPPPTDLVALDLAAAGLGPADRAGFGVPRTRAEAIGSLARAVCAGQALLDPAPGLDEAAARLRALPGIGEWTAQYIALRALGEPDAFPAGDLGLRKAASRAGIATTRALLARAESWRPWRAYAALLLWRSLTTPAKESR